MAPQVPTIGNQQECNFFGGADVQVDMVVGNDAPPKRNGILNDE